jgi:hypothetical protein
MGLWEEVAACLARGEDPRINISYRMLKLPPKGKPGRKKATERGEPAPPFSGYRSAAALGGKKRPRCVNPECKKRLLASQGITCSAECKAEALAYHSKIVAMLKGLVLKPIAVKEVPDVGAQAATTRDVRGKRKGRPRGPKRVRDVIKAGRAVRGAE